MIAAVVVTYSAPAELLQRCIDAVAGEVDRVVVVDTGGSAQIATSEHIERITIANDGYGIAANIGFARATALGARAIVLLNDDVIGRRGWVGPLVAAVDAHGVGAAQPVLLDASTDPPRINSVGVQVGTDGAGTDLGDGAVYTPASGSDEIELFTAGAVAFASDFLVATGGFDRRWFLYYEDIDLARRGDLQGWRYVVVYDSVVEHERGVTTGREPERTRYYRERNRLWAAFRYAGPATIGRALWLSVRRLRYPPKLAHARALAMGLGGAPRELWYRLRRRSVA